MENADARLLVIYSNVYSTKDMEDVFLDLGINAPRLIGESAFGIEAGVYEVAVPKTEKESWTQKLMERKPEVLFVEESREVRATPE